MSTVVAVGVDVVDVFVSLSFSALGLFAVFLGGETLLAFLALLALALFWRRFIVRVVVGGRDVDGPV